MLKKRNIFVLCFIFLSFSMNAFEWPQENVEPTSLHSYFGRRRGNSISTSMVFSDPEPINCTEDGKLLIVMTDEADDSIFFPCAYGTSVIVSHDDSLLSVYGNLDKESIQESLENKTELKTGEYIGYPGNSGWQDGTSSLEFQIIDTKKACAINPKILITRTNTEIPLVLENIILENKAGLKYSLATQKSIPSGIYKIYQKQNKIAVPYRTTITINGVVVDQISYDTVNQENNKIYVSGKKKYTGTDLYPNKELHLLGESMFTAGKLTLGISLVDFLGKQNQQIFNITVY